VAPTRRARRDHGDGPSRHRRVGPTLGARRDRSAVGRTAARRHDPRRRTAAGAGRRGRRGRRAHRRAAGDQGAIRHGRAADRATRLRHVRVPAAGRTSRGRGRLGGRRALSRRRGSRTRGRDLVAAHRGVGRRRRAVAGDRRRAVAADRRATASLRRRVPARPVAARPVAARPVPARPVAARRVAVGPGLRRARLGRANPRRLPRPGADPVVDGLLDQPPATPTTRLQRWPSAVSSTTIPAAASSSRRRSEAAQS
jgi:hypothetical protein